MTIQTICGCGKTLAAPDHLLGKRVRCPACQAILVVEMPAGSGGPETVATGRTITGSADGESMLTIRPEAAAGPVQPTRGGYSLGRTIGKGGMGVVQAAQQEVFGREVAVKSVRPDQVDDGALAQFRAESVVTAWLEHPNIVPVHDLVMGSGGWQLVMKRVEGSSWRDLLHPRTSDPLSTVTEMTLAQHLDILFKVCDALAFAHNQGVLHRDLKPENVMVGAFGEVLVMDWGCAVADGAGCAIPALPQAAESVGISGTPAYMAPEMAKGESRRIGTWSDVYLLGAILYEVLSGAPPHRGPSVRSSLAAAASGTVTRPAADPGRGITGELIELCMSALAADPQQRIRTVADFVAALRTCQAHAEAQALIDAARAAIERGQSRPGHPEAEEVGDAGDSFAAAVALSLRALEQWPESVEARAIAVQARLAYARQACEVHDFNLAVGQATAAGILLGEAAPDAPPEPLRGELNDLLGLAAAGLERDRSRLRVLRQARWIAALVASAALAGLGWFCYATASTYLLGQRVQSGIEIGRMASVIAGTVRDSEKFLSDVAKQTGEVLPGSDSMRRQLSQHLQEMRVWGGSDGNTDIESVLFDCPDVPALAGLGFGSDNGTQIKSPIDSVFIPKRDITITSEELKKSGIDIYVGSKNTDHGQVSILRVKMALDPVVFGQVRKADGSMGPANVRVDIATGSSDVARRNLAIAIIVLVGLASGLVIALVVVLPRMLERRETAVARPLKPVNRPEAKPVNRTAATPAAKPPPRRRTR